MRWFHHKQYGLFSALLCMLFGTLYSVSDEEYVDSHSVDSRQEQAHSLDIPLFLNGYRVGYVTVLLHIHEKSIYLIEPSQLDALLESNLSPEGYAEFQRLARGVRYLHDGQKMRTEDLEFYFDTNSLSIYLYTAKEQSPLWHASFREGPFSLTKEQRMHLLEHETFSGFANLMIGQKFIHSYFPNSVSFSHQTLGNVDLNLNYKDVVFNGFVYYVGNHPVQYKQGQFLLTFDVPNRDMRVNLGEFATMSTSYSQSVPLAGVNINKNRGLYTDAIIGALNRNQVLLNSPSKVEVFLNGSLIKILDLDAGPLPLEDFPLIEGINDVVLRIMGTSGEIRIVHVSMLYYARLLEPGEDEYSFSFGVPTVQYKGSYATRVSLNKFVGPLYLSGLYRRGVKGGLTFGGYLQGDFHQVFGGAEAVYHSYPLYSAYELSISRLLTKRTALRTRLMFGPSQQLQDKYPAAWQIVLTYSDEDFGFFGEGKKDPCYPREPELFNNTMFGIAWGLGISYFEPLGIGFVGEYDVNRIGNNSFRWQVDLAMRTNRMLNMQLIVSQEYLNIVKQRLLGKTVDTRFYFTFNLMPEGRDVTFQSEYNSFQRMLNASATYFKRWDERTLVANAGYMQAPRNHTGTGDITYEGKIAQCKLNRYVAKNRPVAVNTTVDVNLWNAGSAVLWNDRRAGLTRPLSDSFILARPPGGLQKFPILVRSDAESLDVAQQEEHTGHFLEGILCSETHEPLANQRGILWNENRRYLFSTNYKGAFQICNVEAGTYDIQVQNRVLRQVEVSPGPSDCLNLGWIAIEQLTTIVADESHLGV